MKSCAIALLVCLLLVAAVAGQLSRAASDETLQDLKDRAIPLLRAQADSSENKEYLAQFLKNSSLAVVPNELDWRQANRVTSVKYQNFCGSCWAFSAIGALEGLLARETGQLVELSVQQLIECSNSNLGCTGGVVSFAFDDVHRLGGLMTDDDYPYSYWARNRACKFNPSQVVLTSGGSVILPEGDETVLKEVLAKFGPVSVMLEMNKKAQYYWGGIIDDPECSPANVSALNHAALLIGYGTDPKHGDYWLLKNSWSTMWGEQGYFRMKRGVNMCGIGLYSTIPKFPTTTTTVAKITTTTTTRNSDNDNYNYTERQQRLIALAKLIEMVLKSIVIVAILIAMIKVSVILIKRRENYLNNVKIYCKAVWLVGGQMFGSGAAAASQARNDQQRPDQTRDIFITRVTCV